MSEKTRQGMGSGRIAFIAQFSLLAAIEAIFCFTVLGSLPIGVIVATLAGIPIVVTAIMLGTSAGALMGLLTGIFSVIVWTFMPPSPAMAFIFSPFHAVGGFGERLAAAGISIIPRVMVGVFAGVSYKLISKAVPYQKGKAGDLWAYGAAGFFGSMANTFFVLGAIYVFFGERYAELLTVPFNTLIYVLAGVVATNGIAEAAICVICAVFICRPLKLIFARKIG